MSILEEIGEDAKGKVTCDYKDSELANVSEEFKKFHDEGSISSGLDENKIFLINRGNLEGRFDCLYYLLNKSKNYKTTKLKQYIVDVFQGQVQGELENKSIKVLKVKNLNLVGDIDFENVTYVDNISKRKLLLNGDILTPFRGQTIFTKKFAYFESNEKVTIDNNLGVIRLNKELILPKYFYYYISSDIGFQEILKNIVGAGIPALTKHIISELNIPILSKEIQQNIIDIMDNSYKLKKQKEQEAKEVLEKAKNEVEKIILGENYGT